MNLPIVDSKYIDLDIIKKRFNIDTKWKHCDVEEFIKKYGRETYDRINREELIRADIKLRLELIRQYMCLDIDKIFEKYGEEKVISFINKISKYYVNKIFWKGFSYLVDSYGKLSYEVKKKFYDLSLTANKDLKEEYTIEEFLKFSRACFDTAPENIYIDEVSDYYIYANENDFKITDDYRVLSAITNNENVGVIRDPDPFNNVKEFSEEKWHDHTSAFQIKGSSFELIKEKGAYKFGINIWNISDLTRGILMYIGLREKGYNLTVDADEVLKKYERYSIEY